MVLDFDSPQQQNFVSVETIQDDFSIRESLNPSIISIQEQVKLSSIDMPTITPSIQNTHKPTAANYAQNQNNNKNVPIPQPTNSKGFEAKMGANQQIPGKGNSSTPRFGMETQTSNVGSMPEWRRIVS